MPRLRSIAMAAALLAAAALATAAQADPVFSNGGARHWVAWDPNGRTLGAQQFLTKRINVLNVSNAPSAVTVYYEPAHILFCSQTLQPGGMTICGQMSTPAMVNGYLQVDATQPVVVGGSSDTPFMNFFLDAQGNGQADPQHGVVISLPFQWQEGCAPRAGTTCPAGDAVAAPAAPTGTINRQFQRAQ